MKNYTFSDSATGNRANSKSAIVPPTGVPVEIAKFSTPNETRLSISVAVLSGTLNSLNVFARGDSNAAWLPIPRTEFAGYGRTDANTDIATTPAGQSAAINLDVTYWGEVKVEAAASVSTSTSTTAGIL